MRKLFSGIGLSAALIVALAVGSASAQEAQSTAVELTPSRDSGVTGTATFTDVAGGVETTVTVQGLPETGVEHINHIHEGATCADDRADAGGPVEIPLNPIVAQADGTGANTTFIEGVTVAELFSGDPERYVNVHAEQVGEDTPPGISCADLVAAPVATPGLPDTGGPSIALLAGLGGVALVSVAFVTGLVARRRAA